MPYDNHGRFYHTRILSDVRDPYKSSAESLARAVEEFTYNTESPVYMDPQFLAWSVAQFDLSKQGSGRVFDVLDYEHGKESIDYLHPPLPSVTKDGLEYRVRYTREQFNNGEVPNSMDGTQPEVFENHVEQIVRPSDVDVSDITQFLTES